ncbi:MAG: DUF6514 family protein [Clostridiales bacterium]|nr:DUF6514 family protein [Clostridiales bacterium]
MKKECKLQKEFFKMRVVNKTPENPKSFRLEYFILKTNVEVDGMNVTVYGLEVVKKQMDREVLHTETKTIKNITVSYKQIEQIAELMAMHLVTPITLQDVVEDIIVEQNISLPDNLTYLKDIAV